MTLLKTTSPPNRLHRQKSFAHMMQISCHIWIKPKQRERERERKEKNWRGQPHVTRHHNARATMLRRVICTNKPRSTQLLQALGAAAATTILHVQWENCETNALQLCFSNMHINPCAFFSFVHRGLWGQHSYIRHYSMPHSGQTLCTQLAAIAMTVPQYVQTRL